MSNIDKQALRQLAVDAKELAIIKRYTKGIEAQKKFIAAMTPALVLALLDELEAETSYREGAFIACNRWHDKFRESEAKLEAAQKLIDEQREVMRQAASDISYAIFNLTGSDLSRLQPGVVETTDPTDTALIAERSLRAAAGKGEAS